MIERVFIWGGGLGMYRGESGGSDTYTWCSFGGPRESVSVSVGNNIEDFSWIQQSL